MVWLTTNFIFNNDSNINFFFKFQIFLLITGAVTKLSSSIYDDIYNLYFYFDFLKNSEEILPNYFFYSKNMGIYLKEHCFMFEEDGYICKKNYFNTLNYMCDRNIYRSYNLTNDIQTEQFIKDFLFRKKLHELNISGNCVLNYERIYLKNKFFFDDYDFSEKINSLNLKKINKIIKFHNISY